MHIIEYLKAVKYQIAEGVKFEWECYGQNAFVYDAVETDTWWSSVVFDTKTGEIREMYVQDDIAHVHYIYRDPAFVDAYNTELLKRANGIEYRDSDITYVNLEHVEDFIEKLENIAAGKPYDPRVLVKIECTDEQFYTIAKAAHSLDMTVNEFVEHAVSCATKPA